MDLVTKITESISTATSTSSCKNTILITFVVSSIIVCTKFLWPSNNRLHSFTFRPKHRKIIDDYPPYCTVCLQEAVDGEKLRKLPRCNHCFHVGCIDQWFQTHSTCPLCRNQVFALHQRHIHGQGRGFFFCSLVLAQLLLRKLGTSVNFGVSLSIGENSSSFL